MTVSSAVSRINYAGNGATTHYTFPFRVLAATDLLLTSRVVSTGVETTLVYPTDYAVTGVGVRTGGAVDLVVALASGSALAIERIPPILQTTSLRNQGPYAPDDVENALDYRAMVEQELASVLLSAARLPHSYDPAVVSPLLPTPVANTVLTWNGTATGLAGKLWSTSNIASSIVARDGSGNLAAGTITASLTGNVTGNLTGNVAGNLTGDVVGNLTGNVTGNASTATLAAAATVLANARTIAITGDLTYTSAAFNGGGNVTGTGTLATVNANVGTYGDTSNVASLTVNAKGLVTAVALVPITTTPLNPVVAGSLSVTLDGAFGATSPVNITGWNRIVQIAGVGSAAFSLRDTSGTPQQWDIGLSATSKNFEVFDVPTAMHPFAIEPATGIINFLYLHFNGGIIADIRTNANAALSLNYYGYARGATQFRDVAIYDGKNVRFGLFEGSSHTLSVETIVATSGLTVTGNAVVAILNGRIAGAGNFTSDTCTAFGVSALTTNIDGLYDTAFGHSALLALTHGTFDTGVGRTALTALTTGNRDTGLGANALLALTTGDDNTGGGVSALQSVITGSKNTAFGSAAAIRVLGSGVVALGYSAGAYETGSNAFYVDNQDRTNTAGDKAGALLYGTFNATPASQTLTINAALTLLGLGTSAVGVGAADSGGAGFRLLRVAN